MDSNKIFEKVKMKIAISNVKEEDIVMNKRKLNIGKGIGIAACITLSMTGVVLATTQIINKFGANSSDGIQTAIENGYYSDINTEYKEANGISTNIESFLIDNDNFDMNLNIKFDGSYSLQDMLANISDESYKFDSARVSNTAFKIYLSNCNGIAHNENECVETSDGRMFYPSHRSDGDGEISVKEDGIVRYYNTFNLTNYDATDNLKVHLFKENGDEVIVELVKEK